MNSTVPIDFFPCLGLNFLCAAIFNLRCGPDVYLLTANSAAICGAVKIQYPAGLTARSDLTCKPGHLKSDLTKPSTCSTRPPIPHIHHTDLVLSNRGDIQSIRLVRLGALRHHSMRLDPTHQTNIRPPFHFKAPSNLGLRDVQWVEEQ